MKLGKNLDELYYPCIYETSSLCDFFFTLTLVINQRRGLTEIPFVSKS